DGVATFRPDEPYLEPLAALNFIAGCTKRIRLGTHVLIIPYRNPVLTAKILSSLDVLSSGRVILGAGVGWMEEEFQAMGLDTYKERGAVTDEYLQLYKELWTSENPSFDGKYYQISGSGFEPKPAQKPHPPIWIGGHTGPAIRRAAKYGDGWMPIGLRPPAILDPEELGGKIAQLRKLTVEAGRPEDAVDLTFSTSVVFNDSIGSSREMMQGQPEQIAADIRQYQDLGVSNFIIGLQGNTVPELQENMERFSREVMTLIPD
ncbi:MAG: LLM class F420-dependent oxidoreductase, partial [Chloroflexota bacterium]|nr:LLM class F420-dependent oxidoreductase [Chloroflexota bacterium]